MVVPHRWLLAIVVVLAAAAVAGMVVLWPGAVAQDPGRDLAQTIRLIDAELVEVTTLEEDVDFGLVPGATFVEISARIDETGEVITFEMVDDTGDTFAAGQQVRLQEIIGSEGNVTYLVSDFRRGRQLALLVGLFLVAVIGFGRWQGLRALVGLGLTFLIIVWFIVPAILYGRDPVTVALVGAVAIMIVTLYLAHGYSAKTTAAVVGTTCALVVTGLLALLFVAGTNLTGFTSEEARLANLEVGGLSLRGLLLAGIIIGALGVLDDVTMSQSSTVFELRRANPRAGFGELLRGALNVGRDHIAATVNTLFLAYAGAALPLLILFVVAQDSVGDVLTAEIVAVEVVRTLVGSIGLIAAVPVTTALAAGVALDRAPSGERRIGGSGPAHAHPRARADEGTGGVADAAAGRAGGNDHDDALAGRAGGEGPDSGADKAVDAGEEDEVWVDRLRKAYELPSDGEEADEPGAR